MFCRIITSTALLLSVILPTSALSQTTTADTPLAAAAAVTASNR